MRTTRTTTMVTPLRTPVSSTHTLICFTVALILLRSPLLLALPPLAPRGYPQKNFANGFETLQVCSHLGYPSQFAMAAREVSEHSFRRILMLEKKNNICANFGIASCEFKKSRRKLPVNIKLNLRGSSSNREPLKRPLAN